MRIGMLTQWYDPEPGPAAIPGVLARELTGLGHEVSVLTGFPNYPTGQLYPGYRQRRVHRTRQDGVALARVALYPNHSRSAAGRVANYASFAVSAAVSGRAALQGVDGIWVYSSPPTVTLPLLAHSRRGRVPYFLHVQDLWPDSLTSSGMLPGGALGGAAERMARRVVQHAECRAAVIGVLSASVRDLLLERNPRLSPDRIVHAPNPTDEHLFVPQDTLTGPPPDVPWPTDGFTVLYVGAIGAAQGLDTVLDAAHLLRDTPARIVLVGDGTERERLLRRVRDEGLDRVELPGRIGKEEVPAVMRHGSVHLVSLGTEEFLRFTVPSKLASLLASGVPVLGHLTGDGATLVRDAGAGVAVPSGDAAALADAVRRLSLTAPGELAAMGRSGRRYYEAHLSARSLAETVGAALEGVRRTPVTTSKGSHHG